MSFAVVANNGLQRFVSDADFDCAMGHADAGAVCGGNAVSEM
jgi:hypothetical protein